MRERSLTGLLTGLFAAAGVLVAAMFVLLLLTVISFRDDSNQGRMSTGLLNQSYTVERSVLELDNSLRGYLLTRQQPFVVPYETALSNLPFQLATLRGMARNAAERASARQLTQAVSSFVSGYAQPLIATGGRLSETQEIAATTTGKRLVDGLRVKFSQFNAAETALRTTERSSLNSGMSRAVFGAAFGAFASIVLLLALGAYVLRRILLPVSAVAAAARKLSDGNLTTRAPEQGRGEIAMLGRSFNQMAVSIEARDAALSSARAELEVAVTEAREASEMKSNFLANMSHEIRTPLNGVIGMTDAAARHRARRPSSASTSRSCASSGEALLTVINDILDFSKIEAGKLEIEDRDFDLHDVVESSCDMVAASAVSKGIELQSFVGPDVPRTVRGDGIRVSQILVNLLSNAVKFTPGGEVVAEVKVTDASAEAIAVRFEIRDTGIGIAPDRIASLFDPFTQAEVGTTREFGGTGLGLSISRELTTLMGGTIEAESRLGSGSTFRFEIPFGPAHDELPAPVAPEGLLDLRVLIVDDNAANRRIFEAYVNSWGMRPTTAASARAAFAELERALAAGVPFDLVLVDQNMPGERGSDLARRIRANPSLRHTRMILLTSSAGALAGYRSAGFDNHLTKPIHQGRLLDAIGAAMAAGALTSPQHAAGAAGPEPDERAAPAGRRILIAEDQAANWLLIDRLLTKRGHHAEHANNGREALERLATGRYDMVLMDCQMPDLDGYDTAREVRARERGTGEHIPVVAMTAYAMLGDEQRCLEAGMDDYLAKPIQPRELDAILKRWLGGVRAVGEAAGGNGDRAAGAGVDGAHVSVNGAHADGNGTSGRSRAERLDQARLAELRALFSGDEIKEMLRALSAEITDDLVQVSSALADGDSERASAAAHRIGNCARMLGAKQLAGAAAVLERRRNGNGASDPALDTAAIVAELSQRWETARAAVEDEVARAGA